VTSVEWLSLGNEDGSHQRIVSVTYISVYFIDVYVALFHIE